MQLYQLDLSNIKAIGHDGNAPLGKLQVMISKPDGTLEIKDVPAPPQALEGIKLIAQLAAGQQITVEPTPALTDAELLKNITMIPTDTLRCGGSSNIEAIGYESSLRVLQVEFKNGSIYRYFDVPFVKFAQLIKSDSVGQYFNREIKSDYRYEKVA
ncbi:KTSC domain-containing protein [Gloeothece verrucosa]|uniref:KTSC domain-containing protein n=1 Tax=Gloeothece verrucosa (strain PCC 7822) TaxID=497965 RepID=E0UN34_GLOV7|nr:KTSC domain-containing protein [Gloeothece verrucosa]ADN18364.1 conserved hypothetical protein [Gloeothece verrucosa PCC 7822]